MFLLPPKVMHRCIVDIASYERYILHFSAEAMAAIAHPSFREELSRYARENFK